MKKETDVFRIQGKALTILRIMNGSTLTEVAKNIGVSISFISRCEKGKRKLSEEDTKKFLEYIEASEEEVKAFVQLVNK